MRILKESGNALEASSIRVYLAGPMRGYEGWNFAAFDEARLRLTALGYKVFCPASLFRAMPYDFDAVDRRHLLHVIQADLACIYAADAIALLPGWEASVGVTVELALAQFLGLKVLEATTGDEIDPCKKPWMYAGKKETVCSVCKNDREIFPTCGYCDYYGESVCT